MKTYSALLLLFFFTFANCTQPANNCGLCSISLCVPYCNGRNFTGGFCSSKLCECYGSLVSTATCDAVNCQQYCILQDCSWGYCLGNGCFCK